MPKGFYIGVDGTAKKVKRMYVGDKDGVARLITGGYVGVNGVARSVYSDDVNSIYIGTTWMFPEEISGMYDYVVENGTNTGVWGTPLLDLDFGFVDGNGETFVGIRVETNSTQMLYRRNDTSFTIVAEWSRTPLWGEYDTSEGHRYITLYSLPSEDTMKFLKTFCEQV
jgi:hypothetical protein